MMRTLSKLLVIMGTNMIQCTDVTKTFPVSYGLGPWLRHAGKTPRRPALVDVNLIVKPQELFGLLGPNGAGKTTILKLLATLSLPDRGRIVINGIDAARSPDAVKRQIGLCTSEERSFYFRLTARENLQFFGALAGLGGSVLDRRIDFVVDLVDLRPAIDKRFDTFSSGMRQRLALARAMIADPPILLLDEPTRGVDPVHADAMRRLLREELVAKQGKTVVLTTNILEEAWSVCDTIAILNAGAIVAQGSPVELNSKIGGRIRYAVSLDRIDPDLLERLRAIEGVLSVSSGTGGQGTVTIELVAGGRALTQLLNVVSANGTTVRGLRPLDDGLLELFRVATQASEP
jgi:ABC-2 type transport system ATP-binding protein